MTAIKKLHHSAYRCRDSEETRAFYEDFLGLYDRPGAPALPLFVVDPTGRVTVVAADERPRTEPGDTVIAMVSPEALEGDERRPGPIEGAPASPS